MLELGKKEQSPKTKETLWKLQKNHIKICIATGRHLLTMPEFEGIDFDAIIAFNGSYYCAKDDVIYKNPILTETVRRIIKNASSIGRPVALASLDMIGANGAGSHRS